MSAHTPGPWLANCEDVPAVVVGPDEDADSGRRFWTVKEASTEAFRGDLAYVFASKLPGGVTLSERDANARLIAAAPDMLAALELVANSGLFKCFDDGAWFSLNAAIAKAKGG